MSGGSYDYIYDKVRDVALALERGVCLDDGEPTQSGADTVTGPLRRRFARHLERVAHAMRKIEWVDSGDDGPGDEIASILAVFGDVHPDHTDRAPVEGEAVWYEPEDGLRFAGRVLSVHGNQAHVELVGHYAAWANNLSTNDRHPPIKVKVEVGRLHLRGTP